MAEVALEIAGRNHIIACRDGEEPHLRALAERLGRHSAAALHASGGGPPERTMLLLALMMADEVVEMERNPPQGLSPELLDRIADRLESVASALEDDDATS
ncbi:MAG: cell division protein ZapA [Sphingomonas sp.]|nr:cell division protein ZapA [Sphingomonas sp.]|tara:strand:+ start:118 stop:420 length:303 start_codon:yes stop_codon:yes gene_type:complete